MHKLHDKWVLSFHDPEDNDWSVSSYKKLYEVDTIEKFWDLFDFIGTKYISNGMFFFMRDGIAPIWEDEKNEDGGCWSFKISKKDIYTAWIELSIALLGENITNNVNNSKDITGISISPKKTFSIIKIWNCDSTKNSNSLISKKIPYIFLNSSIYKSHKSKK